MSLTAAQHLATHGLTVGQAYDWILANLYQPAVIYNVSLQYGVTSAMLGEITGYSQDVVEAFFDSFGLDGSALRPDDTPGANHAFVPEALSSISVLWTYNGQAAGPLMSEAIREHIINTHGQAFYNAVFDPGEYAGGADGTYSTADLGFTHLGDLPADQATLEALFFGTVITLFRRVDLPEEAAIHAASASALPGVVVDAYKVPVFTDRAIPDVDIPAVCEQIAWLVANNHTESLFTGLIDYWRDL